MAHRECVCRRAAFVAIEPEILLAAELADDQVMVGIVGCRAVVEVGSKRR